MRNGIRPGWAAWVLGLAAALPATGRATEPGGVPPPPVYPRLVEMVQAPKRPAPVPPGMEIEILDPNVDPRGMPAVVTRPTTVMTCDGPQPRVEVDIPPTVLVHRYYYTGDRTFQAQFLPGGPSMVVVNDPRNGERVYIPVQMLPGAPRVTYTCSSIEYNFGTQAIIVSFGWFGCKPKVTYRQGVPVTQKVEKAYVATRDTARRVLNRTGIPEGTDRLMTGGVNAATNLIDLANDVGERLIAPPVALIRATPLGALFTGSPEDQAVQARDAQVRRAQLRITTERDAFIRTNR